MKIINESVKLHTKGNPDLINITDKVGGLLESAKLKKGLVTVFVVGSTAAITTLEYEPGLIKDMQEMFDKIIPQHKSYHHDDTWGDANGFSHLRSSLQGPSLSIPFDEGKLLLGTWQQVVLAEFDNRPRDRKVIVHIIGE
ncbi:MAG: secondary thiamine-phosphate synthase enzyme YjbQ [Candidatus Omnitrophica bacterium]|nr:secondary thiamine-phosphate synthase enzyme YjbQ [Candidatus Omnitrophota bacterium]